MTDDVNTDPVERATWAANHYRELMERHRNDSHRYQALLYHAWKVIREQQRGLKHQQRKLKRLRGELEAAHATLRLDLAERLNRGLTAAMGELEAAKARQLSRAE